MSHGKVHVGVLMAFATVLASASPARAQIPVTVQARALRGTIRGPLGERFTPSVSVGVGASLYFGSQAAIFFHRYHMVNACGSDACSGTADLQGEYFSMGVRVHPLPLDRFSPWLEFGMQNVHFDLEGDDAYGRHFDLVFSSAGAFGGTPTGALGVDADVLPWMSLAPFVVISRYHVDNLDDVSTSDPPGREYYYRRVADPRRELRGELTGAIIGFGLSVTIGNVVFHGRRAPSGS